MNNEPMKTNEESPESLREEHTWTEQIEFAGSELVERTKELIEEGNVRRLIIRNHDDEILLEVPLTAGVAVGGVLTVVAPVLAPRAASTGAACLGESRDRPHERWRRRRVRLPVVRAC